MPTYREPRPTAPAAVSPGTGLDHPGLTAGYVMAFRQNAFLHREIVAKGKFEFFLHAVRHDAFGMTRDDWTWVWDQLVATEPPPLSALEGCILDEYGHVVPATKDDVRMVTSMARTLAQAPTRLFLGHLVPVLADTLSPRIALTDPDPPSDG